MYHSSLTQHPVQGRDFGDLQQQIHLSAAGHAPLPGPHCPAADVEMCRGIGQVTGHAPLLLYDYHQLPAFLRSNPYVTGGYPAMLSVRMCLKSLFAWTNETINIWSHLLGFFMFFVLCLWDNLSWLPSVTSSDRLVITLGLCCFQFCMLCSTGYHVFRCHSERAASQWLALDLTGISVGLLGCYLPGIYLGFYCLSVWRHAYLVVIGMLFVAVFACQTQPRYYSDHWFRRRLMLYFSLTACGLLPALHWVYLNGGLGSLVVQEFAPKILVVYLLGAMAFLFYITKFPEKLFPGRFNFVGSSHQLWHVMVVLAFLWWHRAGHQLLRFRLRQPCWMTSDLAAPEGPS